ncbi:MAG: DoxX family membrane protein [Desulfobacterales bacterium]|nr:MAG: DoxX family membrane protein [Desulfobacterales bacterium]
MKWHKWLKRGIAHPFVGLFLRVYVGGVFIYASMYKINYPAEFAEIIAAYQLIPYWGVNLMTLIMPWTELVAGVLLVLGIRTKSAAAVIAAMLVVFSLAILITLLRGIPIGCGCFTSVDEPLGWGTLARDLVWLAMTIHLVCFPSALRLESLLFKSLREVEA